MKLQSLAFASSNKHKVAEVEAILGMSVEQVALDLPEIQSLDVTEVVEAKTLSAFAQLKRPIMVEDTSLVFTALKGLPGPFIKFFLESIGPAGMTQLLKAFEDRSAKAICCFGIADEAGKVTVITGEVSGQIALQPMGENGFGWDSIFIPEGQTQTFAELGSEVKNQLSHRYRALEKVKAFLHE